MSIWKLLFGFNGRIRRLQYWLGSLMAVGGFMAGLFLFGLFLGLTAPRTYDEALPSGTAASIGIVIIVFYLLLLWTTLALAVKRFHDRDHSGFWVLLFLVPIGNIWAFIELGFLDGTQGGNRFGPSPKGLGVDHEELRRTFA